MLIENPKIQNPKIQKVDAEIGRITDRISKLQSRLEELRGQRAEMYNTDLLNLVRDIPLEQLRTFARQIKSKSESQSEGSDFTV